MFLLPVILASLARVGMLDPPRDMCVAGFMFNNPLQKAPRFWGMLMRLTDNLYLYNEIQHGW